VHRERWLPVDRFKTNLARFVGKVFDVTYVSYFKRCIRDRGLELGQYL
jgi:hypothetical protein